jgi:hypothetical protein
MSAFALEDGVVRHTYSSYARGLDGLWGMYQWLDRAPKGRNETGVWWRRHDEYASAESSVGLMGGAATSRRGGIFSGSRASNTRIGKGAGQAGEK